MIGLIRETARLAGDVVQGVRDEAGRKSLEMAAEVIEERDVYGYPGREKTLGHAVEDFRLAVSDLLFAVSGWAQ